MPSSCMLCELDCPCGEINGHHVHDVIPTFFSGGRGFYFESLIELGGHLSGSLKESSNSVAGL